MTQQRKPWSARRRARFTRTLVVAGLLLALVVGMWWSAGRHASEPAAAPVSTGAGAAPAASMSSTLTPEPARTTGGSGGAITPGRYGDRSSAIPTSASGRFTYLPGRSAPESTPGRVVRYAIAVEDGLGVDAREFADTVATTLLDPRGWQSTDAVRWVNVSPAQVAAGEKVDIRVLLASPATVDQGCRPLNTIGEVSCWNSGRAWLNAQRWTTGAYTYGSDLARYRTYQINHEVGHGLGHGHVSCPGAGRPAPVMLQQTKTLQGCTPWPFPSGA